MMDEQSVFCAQNSARSIEQNICAARKYFFFVKSFIKRIWCIEQIFILHFFTLDFSLVSMNVNKLFCVTIMIYSFVFIPIVMNIFCVKLRKSLRPEFLNRN